MHYCLQRNQRAYQLPGTPKPAPNSTIDPKLVQLYKLVKKPIAFSVLCDRLDLSPARCEALLTEARDRGAPVNVEHDTVSVAPSPALDQVQEIDIPKPVGGMIKIGAISDTHLGSKYCLRGALRETIKWMYEAGVRTILHSGDVLEGCYPHAQYELSHVGFDDQMRDADKVFPRMPGLKYIFISGNHDFTFEERIGMRCGKAIENAFRARGRDDWRAIGDRDAFLKIHGAVIDLWHPRGSGAYAASYHLQKKIESYSAIKPHMLLMGHFHQFCYVYERGIHALMMPCFQGSGSNFAKSLKGSVKIGGAILEWQLSETGRVHSFNPRMRFFYEREVIFEARNELDATEIPAVGRDTRYR
jgi:predicted phosphodiesterase